MKRLLSKQVAARRHRAPVRLAACAWLASTLCMAAHGQTPLELRPPSAQTPVLQLEPPKTLPVGLQPPRIAVNESANVPSTLSPPKRASQVLPPPRPAWESSPVTQLPPLQPTSQLPVTAGSAGSSTALMIEPPSTDPASLAPAIAAVRTQLEILNPPASQPMWRSATREHLELTPGSAKGPQSLAGPIQYAPTTVTNVPSPTRVATLTPPASPIHPIIGNSFAQSVIAAPAVGQLSEAPVAGAAAAKVDDSRSSRHVPSRAPEGPRNALTIQQPPARPPAPVLVAAQPPITTSPGAVGIPTASVPSITNTSPTIATTPTQAEAITSTVNAAAQYQLPPPTGASNSWAGNTSTNEPNPTWQVAPTVEPTPESALAIQQVGEGIQSILMPNEPTWQFNFQNAPWSLVIRNFAMQNGMALQMMADPTGTFTFVDQRPYVASEALDLLNDYLLAEGYLLIRNGSKLTAVSAGGPVQEGLVPFVPMRQIDVLGRNELASVAIPIKSTDATQVLGEIQPLLSRVGRAQVVSNSSRLVVTDTGAYLRRARDILGGYGLAASDMQTVVIHLKNTTAENVAATISAHLGSSFGASSVTTAAGQTAGGGLVQAASFSSTSATVSSARVIPDRETNSLLLSGTPAEVADIQALVCQLDTARAQVVLQGLILEVNLGNTRELGAEVGLQDSVLFNRSVIDNLVTLQQTNTAPNGVQTTSQQVVSQTSAPGFAFNNQALGNNTAISPNVLGAQGLGNLGVGRSNSQLGFGGLVLSASSNSVSLLLRALQANFEVDVLSRPQIRTVDNKEAFIQIGQQVPVVDGVNVTAVGTANPIIRQDQAGIILRMTPNVSPDGLIQIKVSAEKSAFKLQPGTGVPIFTDARNGTVIQAPIKDITTAQATVSARAGQTIVLGGMITRDEETIERRVPGLSRIPLIGRLFRYDYNNATRKELLIFLTPHLITDDASSDAFKDIEIGRLHAPLEHATAIHGELLGGAGQPLIEQVIAPQ